MCFAFVVLGWRPYSRTQTPVGVTVNKKRSTRISFLKSDSDTKQALNDARLVAITISKVNPISTDIAFSQTSCSVGFRLKCLMGVFCFGKISDSFFRHFKKFLDFSFWIFPKKDFLTLRNFLLFPPRKPPQ
jgi:hypothetical protein